VGELKLIRITLQLADRLVKIPKGEVEDVLIKVEEFIFTVDFVVLENAPVENPRGKIPVILGQPFLATSNALINCRSGLMKLTFGNMTIDFNIFNLGKQPIDHSDQPFDVNMIQGISSEHFEDEGSDIEYHDQGSEPDEMEQEFDEVFERADQVCTTH